MDFSETGRKNHSPASFQHLPDEILVNIFKSSPNISTLYSLANASTALSSLFNAYAPEIVDAVLNSTVPSQSRSLMRAVISIRAGSFQLDNEKCDSDFLFNIDKFRYQQCLIGIEHALLRRFVALGHRIHVLSHLCLEQCLQKCEEVLIPLAASPSKEETPEERRGTGFESPSWTEEQRTILSFWRVQFFNELRTGNGKGQLVWNSGPIPSLKSINLAEFSRRFDQNMTVIHSIEQVWASQHKNHTEHPKWFPLGYPVAFDESLLTCRLPAPPAEAEWNLSYVCPDAPSPEALEQGIYHKRQTRPSVTRPSSQSDSNSDSDSDTSDEELYSDTEEGEHEDDDDDDDEEDEALTPERLDRHRHWCDVYLTDYGHREPGHEWQQLDQPSVGSQFRQVMGLINTNVAAGKTRFYVFGAWLKFGFALWEEQRMINLGVWSHKAIANPAPYCRRWYDMLSEDDERYRLGYQEGSDESESERFSCRRPGMA